MKYVLEALNTALMSKDRDIEYWQRRATEAEKEVETLKKQIEELQKKVK